jgi:hypothetical protein
MKLLKTIQRIVEEAETNYYEASKKLERIEKGYEESLRLLELFKKLDNK